MPFGPEPVYQFASLAEYPLKERIMIRVADLAFYLMIQLLGGTAKLEVHGRENLEAVESSGKPPIMCFWHDRIFLGTFFWRSRGIVVMTSKSFDGEYIARFIQRFGYGAVRGSSSKGGMRGLVEMVKGIKAGMPMAFTIDGPRGPRYVAKRGAVTLARKSGSPILPFIMEAKRFWTVNSWDRLQIPMPFTKAAVIIAKPIYVEADADESTLDLRHAELQRSLDDLVEEGRRWRENA